MTILNMIFFRHGETDYNAARRLQGQTDRSARGDTEDIGLNANGRTQINSLITHFKTQHIALEMMLSSPLLRARQSAEQVAKAFDIPCHYDENLREIFFGADYEGMKIDEFKALEFVPPIAVRHKMNGDIILIPNGQKLRELHKDINPAFDELRHPGGESKEEALKRIQFSVRHFARTYPHIKIVGIACHNAVLRFLISTISPAHAINDIDHAETIHLTYDLEKDLWGFVTRQKVKDSVEG